MTPTNTTNRLTKLLGIEIPLIQGGMTWVSRHELAAAVSECGALGVIGAGSMDPGELQEEIRALRRLTSKPFAVNVPLVNVRPDGADVTDDIMKVVMSEKVPIVIVGAGSPRRYTSALQAAGARVIHVVPSVKLAIKVENAGVDAVIAESSEAGGHIQADGLSAFSLIPQVVDAVSIPVIAAGGISDGRGMAAALALGADAVQLGTRFIATEECNAHQVFKKAVLDAGPEGTAVYSRAWHASRALKTPIIAELARMEDEGSSVEEICNVRGKGRAKIGCIDGDWDEGILPAGASAGLVKDIIPAAQVVAEIMAELHATLGSLNAAKETENQSLETVSRPKEQVNAKTQEYLPLLDFLRIVASLSVVHHHMRENLLFGVGLGLPLFLVLFFALSATSNKDESLIKKFKRKCGDLLVPWVRWSLFYIALLLLSDYARGLEPFGRMSRSMLLIGGNAALWFLPFAAMALVVAEFVRRLANQMHVRQALIFLVALGVISTQVSVLFLQQAVADPFANWIRALPAIPWGLAIGHCHRSLSGSEKSTSLGLIMAVAVSAIFFIPHLAHPNDIALRMACAVVMTGIGFLWRPNLPAAVRHIATLSFGVYLLHPFVGKLLFETFDVFSWSSMIHGNVAWILSLAGVYLIRRIGLKWRELRPNTALPGCP